MREGLSSLGFWAVFGAILLAFAYPTIEAIQADRPDSRASPRVLGPTTPGTKSSSAAAIVPSARRYDDAAFTYSGRWEHVRQRYDGRPNGRSSRSRHAGSHATLRFAGRAVRLYGVVGPGGGLGIATIDGKFAQVVNFYAPVKAVHKLVYTSPPLAPGRHRLTISVISDRTLQAAHTRYVNLGGAEVSARQAARRRRA